MKGISPLIATVLLIAFTIGVAGIINIWLSGFTRTSTDTVREQADTTLICSYGGLNIKSLKYNSTTRTMTGAVENTGTIPLGNLTIQIVYNNATDQKFNLCTAGGTAINCSVHNTTLKTREQTSFNVSSSSNYEKIRVISNCSTSYDEATSSEVS